MSNATRVLLLGCLLLFGVAIWLTGALDVLSPAALADRRHELSSVVERSPVSAAAAFVAIYVVVAASAMPVSAALTLTGGFLFGRWLGTALVILAATLGATIMFFVAQTAIGAPLRRRAGPLYQKLASEANSNGFNYMLFLRLMPIFPFPLVTLVAALLGVRTRTFILATLLGICPATFVFANFGRQLGLATSIADVLSPTTLLALGAIGCLALLPVVYRRLKSRSNLSSERV